MSQQGLQNEAQKHPKTMTLVVPDAPWTPQGPILELRGVIWAIQASKMTPQASTSDPKSSKKHPQGLKNEPQMLPKASKMSPRCPPSSQK